MVPMTKIMAGINQFLGEGFCCLYYNPSPRQRGHNLLVGTASNSDLY